MPSPIANPIAETDLSGGDRAETRPVKVRGPLSIRVILLTLLLVPLNDLWMVQIEFVRYSDMATTQALFFNAVAILLALVGLNSAVAWFFPCQALSKPELAALYVAINIASNLTGVDQLQILFTQISYIYLHANASNNWEESIIPNLPRDLVVTDHDALHALYAGNSSLYRWGNIRPWLIPLGWWTLFAVMLTWTMLCLASLFRKQWASERLSYPIVEVPFTLIAEPAALFRAKPFWIGAAIGGGCEVVNLLHYLYPIVPIIPIGVQRLSFSTPPFSFMGEIPVCFFPFAFGLAFLLPSQLAFSVWFFMLIGRLEAMFASMAGYEPINGQFPYIQQQGMGAVLGIFLITVWAARGHLKIVWRRCLGDPEWAHYDDDEPMTYRMVIGGILAGVAGMVLFAMKAGMRFETAVIYLSIFLVIVVVVARLRAQVGIATFALSLNGPDQTMINIAGTHNWSTGDLAVMSLFYWLSRTSRQFPMQTQVDALQLGAKVGADPRRMTAFIFGTSVFAVIAAFWSLMHTMYGVGFETGNFLGLAAGAYGVDPWNILSDRLHILHPVDSACLGGYLFGCLFTLLLASLHMNVDGWPLQPIGYLASSSFEVFRLWVPILITWAIKVALLRYGGIKAYRLALPFFLGLTIGEFSFGFVRTLLDLGFGIHLGPFTGMSGL